MSVQHTSFFVNETATTEIYTLSLHDALPISEGQASNLTQIWGSTDILSKDGGWQASSLHSPSASFQLAGISQKGTSDRKSTRLNSSHANISYAVFCLKKKHPSSQTVVTRRPP